MKTMKFGREAFKKLLRTQIALKGNTIQVEQACFDAFDDIDELEARVEELEGAMEHTLAMGHLTPGGSQEGWYHRLLKGAK